MPRTRKQDAAEQTPQPAPGLRCSDIPGVYLNQFNVPCDHRGLALGFQDVKRADRARLAEAGDAEVTSPAQFLRALALDPRQPLMIRVDAAKAAAPYFDRKQPSSIDGGVGPDGAPLPLMDLSKLSDSDLEEVTSVLRRVGLM